ncbi:MAG: hypothetical protein PHC69_04635 [Ruminiclostridium sp.]|nr:hypothetical protein [Ruminiclostridium sp.]
MRIETTIDAFLLHWSNCRKNSKSMAYNLLKSDKAYSLLQINGSGELVLDEVKKSITESVKQYTRVKDNAIAIYKDYLEFLKKDPYKINIELEFPPIPVSIDFERIMFIAKYLQNPEHNVEALNDILWVGMDTIDDDIRKLRGMTNNPLQVCGKKFRIEDTKRWNGRVTMPSTAHPIFLTSNLTQILVTLKGLKKMSKDSAYKGYAVEMARSIWTQLSDYAKERILDVAEDLLPDDAQWYLSLNDENKISFLSEVMCSVTEGAGCVIDCLKNGKKCFIEYQDEDNSIKIYKNCKVENYYHKTLTILSDNNKLTLKADNILRSSYMIEELI